MLKLRKQFMNKLLEEHQIKLPHLFRRGLIEEVVNIEGLIKAVEDKRKIILTFQRRPSTESITFAHLAQLTLMKELQEALDCEVVVSILNDAFYFENNLNWEFNDKFVASLVKDVQCIGFNPEKTRVLLATEQIHHSYHNCAQIARNIPHAAVIEELGVTGSSSVGSIYNVAHGIALTVGSSLGEDDAHVVVFTTKDHSPYTRLAKRAFTGLNWEEPSYIYMKPLPALSGRDKAMTARVSPGLSTPFVRGVNIKNLINKKALSGGRQTLEEQRELGGIIEIDIAFAYLEYFLENDAELEAISTAYSSGEMMTGELKAKCIEVMADLANKHNEAFMKL